MTIGMCFLRAPLFLIPGIFGTIVGVTLFRSDYTSPHRAAKGEKRGVIIAVRGDVKHRPATSYLWSDAQATQRLHLGDGLRTGPNGVAQIEIVGGGSLALDNNMMIIFDEKLSVQTRANPRTSTTVYQSEEVSLARTQAKPQNDPALEGEGAPAVGLGLISPLHHQFYVDAPTPFLFQWQRDPLADRIGHRYRLELALDSKFQRQVLTHVTSDDMITSTDLAVEPGSYYWRVRIINLRGEVVKETRSIYFTFGLSPALRQPSNDERSPGRIIGILH